MRYAHEREALEFLRDVLQDRDPNFVYSNFEFIADDGSVNEVDALVVTQAGVFLIELKSRGGTITGNRHLWDRDKDGHTITVDSPLSLINSKARKLAGLLSKQRAFRSGTTDTGTCAQKLKPGQSKSSTKQLIHASEGSPRRLRAGR